MLQDAEEEESALAAEADCEDIKFSEGTPCEWPNSPEDEESKTVVHEDEAEFPPIDMVAHQDKSLCRAIEAVVDKGANGETRSVSSFEIVEERREEERETSRLECEVVDDDSSLNDLWAAAMGPRSARTSSHPSVSASPRSSVSQMYSARGRPPVMPGSKKSPSQSPRSQRTSDAEFPASPDSRAVASSSHEELEEVLSTGPLLPDPPDEICARIRQYTDVAQLLEAAIQLYETLCAELTKPQSHNAVHAEMIARYSERCQYVAELVNQHVWTHERAPEVLEHLRAATAAASCIACWPEELPSAEAFILVPADNGRMQAMSPEQFSQQANPAPEPASSSGDKKPEVPSRRRSFCPCRRRHRPPPPAANELV